MTKHLHYQIQSMYIVYCKTVL